MALSDEERRLLEQMEAALAAEDPRLAHTLRGGSANRRLRGRRAALSGLGFVLGAVLLVVGMQSHWAVSVVGFLVMLVSTVAALTSVEKVDGQGHEVSGPRVVTGQAAASSTPFMDKMEERWRRRQDGDDA